jgi:hypothetical protein
VVTIATTLFDTLDNDGLRVVLRGHYPILFFTQG